MPGVSRLKGGCVSCRVRRVKCQGGIPCERCLFRRTECRPYSRDFIFVPQTGPDVPQIPTTATLVPREGDTYGALLQQNPVSWHSTVEAFATSGIVNGKQFVAQYVQSFPKANKLGDGFLFRSSFSSMQHLCTTSSESESLQHSGLAVASAGLARERGDLALLRNASNCYGKALVSLQRDIYSLRVALSDATLLACQAMNLYQFTGHNHTMAEWISHAKGLGIILQLRGPSAHISGVGRAIFESCRINLIVAALCQQEDTFLGQDAWKDLSLSREARIYFEEMVDILVGLPSLVARGKVSDSWTDPVHTHNAKSALFQECLAMMEALEEWYRELPAGLRDPVLIRHPLSLPIIEGDSVDEVFQDTYEFSDIGSGQMHLLYFSSLALVYHLIQRLDSTRSENGILVCWSSKHRSLSEGMSVSMLDCPSTQGVKIAQEDTWASEISPLDLPHLSQLEKACESIQMAKKVCMSIRWCLENNSTQDVGPYHTGFPLYLAYKVFKRNLPLTQRHLDWCNRLITMLEGQGIKYRKGIIGIYNESELLDE